MESYTQLVATADRTFAMNQRVRAHARRLRDETNAPMFTYRQHRFVKLLGASDATEDGQVRRLLREFASTEEQPKSHVGYSQGSMCQACGNPIKVNDLEYELVASKSDLRLDVMCYQVFLDEQSNEGGATGR